MKGHWERFKATGCRPTGNGVERSDLNTKQGNTPEDRSGKIKGVFPWGDGFPPPNDSANYAGSESRARRTGNMERNPRLSRCVPSDGTGLGFQGERAWPLQHRG